MRGQNRILSGLALTTLLLLATPSYSQDEAAPTPTPPSDSCLKSCTLNADCGIGGFCQENVCKPVDNYCSNERWSMNDRGDGQNCNAYRCDQQSGTCLRTAQSSSACTLGYVFDGKNLCVPSVNCSSGDEACQDLKRKWAAARDEYETSTPMKAEIPLSCRECHTIRDCQSGEMCSNNTCVKERPVCEQDIFGAYFSVFRGKMESCSGFQCDVALGECLKICFSQFDCQQGYSCENSRCKASN